MILYLLYIVCGGEYGRLIQGRDLDEGEEAEHGEGGGEDDGAVAPEHRRAAARGRPPRGGRGGGVVVARNKMAIK